MHCSNGLQHRDKNKKQKKTDSLILGQRFKHGAETLRF